MPGISVFEAFNKVLQIAQSKAAYPDKCESVATDIERFKVGNPTSRIRRLRTMLATSATSSDVPSDEGDIFTYAFERLTREDA
jgi:hypothetical protein